jgi:uracil-DNA glycosylase
MSLDLDQRQRAILNEMGVQVWWPQAVAAASEAAPEAPPLSSAAATARPTPAPMPKQRPVASAAAEPAPLAATPVEGVNSLDWSTLAQTVAGCTACKLSLGRRSAVFAAGIASQPADWMVIGEPPDDNEERLGLPFAGQAGQLLDNMLKAVGVRRRSEGDATPAAGAAYVSNCVKCRPAVARNPEAQELLTCESYLQREVALVQPKVILALGRFAAQTLLQGSQPDVVGTPLGKLRGRIYRYQDIPVIVSYHPAYLLRTPQDKARAWADLCLAKAAVAA